jgi:hypothetical protein
VSSGGVGMNGAAVGDGLGFHIIWSEAMMRTVR